MTNPNDHIVEYLDWYVGLPKPGFAVMLSGEWGSGKTYFIEQYQEHVQEQAKAKGVEPRRFLYVSLNGLRSTDEINREIFFALHPGFDNKASRVFSRIAVTTGKILGADLNEFGKLSKDLIDGANDKVLIFDDLERYNTTASSVEEVFGYINRFVEHTESNVVVVCNEGQFSKGLGVDAGELKPPPRLDSKRYFDIKEKVVAKTLGILPDVEPALDAFLASISGVATKDFLTPFRDTILGVFMKSEANNLRVLKHLLIDFDGFFQRFVPALGEVGNLDAEAHETLLETVLLQHMCLSLDIGKNRIWHGDLQKEIVNHIGSSRVQEAMRSPQAGRLPDGMDGSAVERMSEFIARYREVVEFSFYGLSLHLWRDWFSAGCFDADRVVEYLSNSVYVSNQPVWAKLWAWGILEDSEFEATLAAAREELKEGKMMHPGVFLHLAGTFLDLAEAKAIPESREEIGTLFKELMPKTRFEVVNIREHVWPHPSYGGKVVSSQEKPEFKSILQNLREELVRQAGEKVDQQAILDILAEGPRQFYEKFSPINPREANPYLVFPALATIDAEKFFEELMKVPNQEKYIVFGTLESRSRDKMYDNELGFIKALRDTVQKHLDKAEGVMPSTLALRRAMNKELAQAIGEIEHRKREREGEPEVEEPGGEE